MRITPNQPRLRAIGLGCWVLGGWCLVYAARLMLGGASHQWLAFFVVLLGLLALAVGISFWLLGSDRRAGIVFDAKGLLLNLGHSSAFIAWENIERIGVARHRASLFDLGSRKQLGIALRDAHSYVQSYEQRLPSGRGALAGALRALDKALRPFRRHNDRPLVGQMAHFRARTGYDVLIPEALLGGTAEAFAHLVESYRLQPDERVALDGMAWAG
jgi:hypothetical protein